MTSVAVTFPVARDVDVAAFLKDSPATKVNSGVTECL